MSRAVAAPQALDRNAVPWLWWAALMTIAPHAQHQPVWLSIALAGLFAGTGWLWRKNERLPGPWPLALLALLACAGIFLEFRTLLGRDAGVAMLALFLGLKLFELRGRRDAYVLVMLGYFLLLTHYFHSQSIPTGLWLLVSLIALTAALVRLHGGPACGLRPSLGQGALMIAQAIPFMLVLYLLFPRISGPLWGLPKDAHAGKTGLTEEMSPGQISQLAQSGEIAFRARFDHAAPDRKALYWRGPVLEINEAGRWRQAQAGRETAGATPPVVERLGPLVTYTLTLEAHNKRWLLALDAPARWPEQAALDARLVLLDKKPVLERQRLELTSVLAYRFNSDEALAVRQRNLTLPAGFNPRTLALARQWQAQDAAPQQLVQRALTLFHDEPFVYTLQPPLLGKDSVDDFLFSTRRGFCEHYAAAFVTLMRAAGVPARVVTGYQGGELNPLDGYIVVRQSDAHAWAEVWLAGQGWVRVDPTAAVAPSRVESGIGAAVAAGEPLPALMRVDQPWLRGLRHRWEALNNAWNQQVLGYDAQRQRQLLWQLGLASDWPHLAATLAVACGGILSVLLAWALYQRRPRLDPASRWWRRALGKLARRGFASQPWEAPLALAARAAQERPDLADAMARIAQAYCAARYGPSQAAADSLAELKDAVQGLSYH